MNDRAETPDPRSATAAGAPSRRVAVVADSHLGGPGGDEGPLIEQLRSLPDEGCDHLLLLGDIFQLWIGDRRYETPGIARMVETLAELRARGVRIDYVEGNRDFFLGEGPYAHAFDRVVHEVAFETGGKRFLAVHGDGIDVRDWKYRFWRALSKSRPSRFGASLVPRRFAQRLVFGTERKLSATNQKHKRSIPEEVLRRYGRRRLAEGHDVLLLGHFHEPRRLEVPEGEVRLLDAWYNSPEIVWLS